MVNEDFNKLGELLERLSHIVDGLEQLDLTVPDHVAVAEDSVRVISETMSGISLQYDRVSGLFEEMGASPERTESLSVSINNISSAFGYLAVHLRVLGNLLSWMNGENPYEPLDKGMAVFEEASGIARSVEPPESIEEIYGFHQRLLRLLDAYVGVFSKMDEARKTGNVELAELASQDIEALDQMSLQEPLDMYSLKDMVRRAETAFSELKKELI